MGEVILGVGYYKGDVSYVLEVLRRAEQELGCDCVVLISSNGHLKEEAEKEVGQSGFPLVEMPAVVDVNARNPFRRARLLKKANSKLAQEILRKSRATLILATNDFAGHWFFPTATQLGIPSLYMQWTEVHSFAVHQAWWNAERRYTDRKRPPLRRWKRRLLRPIESLAGLGRRWPMSVDTTAVAVQGPFYKRMAVKAGVPASKILVTGNPQCDEIHEALVLTSRDQTNVTHRLGLQRGRGFALHAREHWARMRHLGSDEALRVQREIIESIRAAAPDLAVVVKLHPKEGQKEAQTIRAVSPDVTIVKDEVPAGELIAAAKIVVSTTSSMLLWAVGIDRPAISAFFWRGVDEFRQRRHWPGVELADTPLDLQTATRRNLCDPEHRLIWEKRREKCRKDFLVLDGKCTDRIVSALRELGDKDERFSNHSSAWRF